jgi:hypothetical protein
LQVLISEENNNQESELKYGIFVHPKRPKLALDVIKKKLQSAGLQYSAREPDVAIVVGGDGTFGYYGRTLNLPLLFVGVREQGILSSKARLAEVMSDRLEKALFDIESGKHQVTEIRMLRIELGGKYTDVLTDIYLERGSFSGCIRYVVSFFENGSPKFKEYAIGNGVIISTAFGSGGYYSYPDRLGTLEWDERQKFSENRIGICHIIPTYLVRERDGMFRPRHKLSYTVPFQSRVQINLARDTDTRLYGITPHSRGIGFQDDDTLTVTGSDRRAKIIKLQE